MYIRCPICGTYLKTTLGDSCFDKTKPYHYSYKCEETQNKIVKCPVCGTIFSVKILYSYPLEKNASIINLPDANIENEGENKFKLPPLPSSYLKLDTTTLKSKNAMNPLLQGSAPNVVYCPNGFNGYKYWMSAILPYDSVHVQNIDYSDEIHYSLTLLASNDGTIWNIISNSATINTRNHDLICGLDGKLHIIWSDISIYHNSSVDVTFFYYLKAVDFDGTNWTNGRTLITESTEDSTYATYFSSPTLLFDNGKYKFYSIRDAIYLRESDTLENLERSNQQLVNISDPNNLLFSNGGQLFIETIDIQKYNNKYYMLMTLTDQDGNFQGVKLLTSEDGINWVLPSDYLINKGPLHNWDASGIDKATGIFINDTNGLFKYLIWYSSSNQIGYTEAYPIISIDNLSINNKLFVNNLISQTIETRTTFMEKLGVYGIDYAMAKNIREGAYNIFSYELEQNLTVPSNHYMQIPLPANIKFVIPDNLTLTIEDNAVLFVYQL